MISEYINGIDWVEEFKDKNVQESYTGFLRHYNKACELYIPKIDISGEIKPRVKWLTRGMKNNMRRRLNLWHSNQRSKWENPSLKKEYEHLKKMCQGG